MKRALRLRFYPETALGMLTGIMFLVTLVNREWIEAIFRVDPDEGSGTLEWAIVGGLLVVTLVLFFLARAEWRRAKAALA